MRTSVDLPDELFRRVKAAAALHGKSLKEFLTEILIEAVAEQDDDVEMDEAPCYGHPGPIPVTIPKAGRTFKSLTNAELYEIFLREESEQWDK
jgi:hypothetical protein